jgi:hypothetical protein
MIPTRIGMLPLRRDGIKRCVASLLFHDRLGADPESYSCPIIRVVWRHNVRTLQSALSLLVLALTPPDCTVLPESPRVAEIPADVLADKIRGGLLGELFGNLNGLPHEMKYIDEPGKVESYTPGLPEGARTDDDTDIEWVYVTEMAKSGTLLLPPDRIVTLWKAHVNRGTWCANRYARQLMDLGIEPPLTGRIAINPWAEFNISGQFLCEAFGLMSPGMPRTAARIGLHYTHVAIDGEPAQTTQLFAAMIATAFFESDPVKIVEAGVAAVDPASETHRVVMDVRGWWREHPSNWLAARRLLKERYQRHGGAMRDKNGYELNTGATIAALLYGRGDFVDTMKLAFNFGWDADNNAATAATILGVVKGRAWMDAQGWIVKDVYRNTTRDGMPADETLTGYADKIIVLARKAILDGGGSETTVDGRPAYRVCWESPATLEPLPAPLDRLPELRAELEPTLQRDLDGDRTAMARAAYLSLCLGESERLIKVKPSEWSKGVEALKTFPEVVKQIFDAPGPLAEPLKTRAAAEGLKKTTPR